MCIFGYFEGITKDREVVRKLEDSLPGKLFIGYDIDETTPWHSTVSMTRAILPKEVFADGEFKQVIDDVTVNKDEVIRVLVTGKKRRIVHKNNVKVIVRYTYLNLESAFLFKTVFF